MEEFIWLLADGEAAIEQKRRQLCQTPGFSPESMFKLVAGLNSRITAPEVAKFLGRPDLGPECEMFVNYFDSGSSYEKQIELNAFLGIVLPSKSKLRVIKPSL